jgi:hypothetical protein
MRKRTWLLLAALFSSAVLSLPTMAQASFFQPPRYAGSGNLFTADFNGDGKPDLLSGDGTLNLGNGNGTLIAKPKIGGTPVAVADFNADGRADVLELGTGTILVFLGNGDGTFRPPISTPSGADLSNVAVADMNGDGKPDVVGIFNYNIMVYIAKGDGTFQSGIATNTGLTSAKPLLSLGDFNGDNRADIVLSTADCCSYNTGQETVFLGKGDGTFETAKVTIADTYWQSAIAAVGDFNGDGRLDLAIGGSNFDQRLDVAVYYWLFLGNGDGTFQPAAVLYAPLADAMVAADMDGDGNLDLVLERFPVGFPGSVAIYPGKGDGSFSNPKSYMTSEDTVSGIAITDFNVMESLMLPPVKRFS